MVIKIAMTICSLMLMRASEIKLLHTQQPAMNPELFAALMQP
jgi:hypothetical protein